MEAPIVYRSYLLRIWQVREEAGLAWRASLKEVMTGQKRGFTGIEELVAYLRTSMGIIHDEENRQNDD